MGRDGDEPYSNIASSAFESHSTIVNTTLRLGPTVLSGSSLLLTYQSYGWDEEFSEASGPLSCPPPGGYTAHGQGSGEVEGNANEAMTVNAASLGDGTMYVGISGGESDPSRAPTSMVAAGSGNKARLG